MRPLTLRVKRRTARAAPPTLTDYWKARSRCLPALWGAFVDAEFFDFTSGLHGGDQPARTLAAAKQVSEVWGLRYFGSTLGYFRRGFPLIDPGSLD
jgi:hypothetical protein